MLILCGKIVEIVEKLENFCKLNILMVVKCGRKRMKNLKKLYFSIIFHSFYTIININISKNLNI